MSQYISLNFSGCLATKSGQLGYLEHCSVSSQSAWGTLSPQKSVFMICLVVNKQNHALLGGLHTLLTMVCVWKVESTSQPPNNKHKTTTNKPQNHNTKNPKSMSLGMANLGQCHILM